MREHQSPMMKQLYSVPDLMNLMADDLHAEAKRAVSQIDAAGLKKIILTGCGDSLCSVMAAKYALMEYTDLEVEVVPVIDLSRFYEGKRLTGDVMTVIVSNSGKVARCEELASRIEALGGTVMAVSGNASSPLAVHAAQILKMSIPKFEYAPGIRSYCGCLSALYVLALELGRVRKNLEEEKSRQVYEEMKRLPELLREYLPRWEEQAWTIADSWKECSSFEFIGSGISYANAWFNYAKSLETTGKPTGAYNTEDWFHMNYFIRDVTHTATALFVNRDGQDRSRADELLSTASEMGRPIIVISDTDGWGDVPTMVTPGVRESLLDGLFQYIPLSMVLSCVGDLMGEVYFRDGKGRFTACVDCATIIQSRQVILP